MAAVRGYPLESVVLVTGELSEREVEGVQQGLDELCASRGASFVVAELSRSSAEKVGLRVEVVARDNCRVVEATGCDANSAMALCLADLELVTVREAIEACNPAGSRGV